MSEHSLGAFEDQEIDLCTGNSLFDRNSQWCRNQHIADKSETYDQDGWCAAYFQGLASNSATSR